MDITIVTGLSGSGKSMAVKILEDMGFFCIDNMPPQLVGQLTRVLSEGDLGGGKEGAAGRVALVMDTRNPHFVEYFSPVLTELQNLNIPVRILFLEASDAALINRYNQSRRDHPMAADRSLPDAISEERKLLIPVRELATDIMDTTDLSGQRMRERLLHLFGQSPDEAPMTIYLQSFGFKYGLPLDSDMVLDVRFVPNPFYFDELRPLSGLDRPVIEFLEQFNELNRFLEVHEELLEFVIPYYIREGKQRFSIGVGCTGGRHRSVMAVGHLAGFLRALGYRVNVLHRDLKRDVRTRLIEQFEEAEAQA
ncbi:MAG: RNase adapter RapZ [Clostridiaceae bacterium]|nr:RNase adapter RapZ [Clostridiaceae bacterium]